jgi:hypothetical protein
MSIITGYNRFVNKVVVKVRVVLSSVPKQVLARIQLGPVPGGQGARLFPMAEHQDLREHLGEGEEAE